jgi:hypothetical protein
MTEETKQKLRNAGREDLIETHYLLESGYAGIDKEGRIVDRRLFPDTVPIQENPMFNTPKPKPVNHG